MGAIAQSFLNRKMWVILLLGFSSGIPLALVGATLQAWMTTEGIDLSLIGVFSLVGLPYTLKFIWAPALDRYTLPFLGRRRGWILTSQIFLLLSILGMAFSDPKESLPLIALFSVLVAFSSASQDIVVDAYKAEILEQKDLGLGAGVFTMGYRLAMLTSGAVALILADHLSWKTVYSIMILPVGLGMLACLIAPEPSQDVKPPRTLRDAVLLPFVDFFKRKGILELLSFIVLYKLDTVVAVQLMTPFMLGLGFSKTDIGAVTKGFGLVATILGSLIGGAWLTQLGIYRALWVFGILQGIAGLCFYMLAHLGHHFPMMVIAITAENFFSGMGNAAYLAFIMSLCNPQFTGTQYALLSSLMALTRTVAGAPTGWLAKTVGWETYFLISISLAIPGLLLLTRYPVWMNQKSDPPGS
jgi:PAT family beta-lactamase induction signal transducer AmpG